MGYFPNGTAGMCFEDEWCAHCVHSKFDEDEGMCVVMLAHNMYNYEFCNDKEHPAKVMLDWLIPMSDDGLSNTSCAMFSLKDHDKDAGKHFDRDQRAKYEAAMAEMRAGR